MAIKESGERITKYIAHSGLCSRRAAEKLIFARRVQLNGQVVTMVAARVQESDVVTVDENVIKQEGEIKLWVHYKPKNVVSTHSKAELRPTLFECLPEHFPRVVSVGRLNLMTEGLILLTNNGELAHRLELLLPHWKKIYRIELKSPLGESQHKWLQSQPFIIGPVNLGDLMFLSVSELDRKQIKTLESINCTVTAMSRIKCGDYTLDGLKPGEVREVSAVI